MLRRILRGCAAAAERDAGEENSDELLLDLSSQSVEVLQHATELAVALVCPVCLLVLQAPAA